MRISRIIAAALGLAFATAAIAQDQQPPAQPEEGNDGQLVVDVTGGQRAALPIAVPFMPTPAATDTPAGNTQALGQQVAQIVVTDLGNSGLFTPIGPGGLPAVSFPQVEAPDFAAFSSTGAQNLVQGFVQANGNGTLTVGCYLFDVGAQSQLARAGLCRPAARLAPRRPSLRRFHLFAADRRGRLFRHAHRLRLGDRARRGGGSSGWRSWIMTAPTTAS